MEIDHSANSPIFYNPNFQRNIYKGTQRGKPKVVKQEMLVPSNFGLNEQKFSNLAFGAMFEENIFLTKDKLEDKLGTKINFLDYGNLKQIATKMQS